MPKDGSTPTTRAVGARVQDLGYEGARPSRTVLANVVCPTPRFAGSERRTWRSSYEGVTRSVPCAEDGSPRRDPPSPLRTPPGCDAPRKHALLGRSGRLESCPCLQRLSPLAPSLGSSPPAIAPCLDGAGYETGLLRNRTWSASPVGYAATHPAIASARTANTSPRKLAGIKMMPACDS